MKTGLVMLVACLLSLSAIADTEKWPINEMSYQDTSCGAWVGSQNSVSGRAQYSSWFRGFVSGYNYGNPANQVLFEKMPNPETFALYVDKYCRENPLSPFTSAVYKFVKETREIPEPLNTTSQQRKTKNGR